MSTTVLIDLAHLTGTATNGASTGMVEVRYSKRIEPANPASQIVVVRSFAVKLDATGKASVVVPPSEVDGFYTWAERVEGGTTRYTSVPDVPTVNYRTLVDVDPATFDPTVDATAAWYLALAALELGDLADVDTTDLADGFTLVWEAASSTWKVGAGGAGASALADLTDVDLTDLADGDALVWDATAGTWVRVPLSSTYVAQAGPASVAGLSPTTDGAGGYSWEPGGSGLPGADGDDGREVELQTSATHVQWRYVGEVAWTDLIALSAITGPAGTDGAAGVDGDDGLSVELQTTATHIQWRLVGGTWADLVALSTITGPAGADGEDGAAGADGADGEDLTHATPQTINAQTGAYTLVAADAGKLVQMTLTAAADLTVPASVFTAGQRVDLSDRGTARVTVVAGAGMTVNPPPGGTLVMEGRYAYASLVFVSATEADLVGLVAAA